MLSIRLAALSLIAFAAGAKPPFLSPRVSLSVNQNFCTDGVYPTTIWLEGKPKGINTWGSYCKDGDRGTGMAATVPFVAPAHLRLYLAGYPSSPRLALEIENLSDGSMFPFPIQELPRERWMPYDFALPPSWQGKLVRIVADDHNTGLTGWLAFSEPLKGSTTTLGLAEARQLLFRTILHFVLIMLPCFAVCAIAVYRGVRDVVVVGLIALAATSAAGYLVFWLWFIWPRLGHLVAFLIPLLSAICIPWLWRRFRPDARTVLRALIAPLLLVFAASLLVLSTGFAFGGLATPLTTPWVRFSHPLPPDNTIPYLVAEGVRTGHIRKPLLGDWHSSDRPPLQSGIVLSQYPYMLPPRPLGYSVVSSIAQSFWIFALWLVLIAFGVNARAAVLALSVCLFSGFVFLNTFFVWPKLLAASYVLGLLAILLSNRLSHALRTSSLLAITAGVLLAFAALAHGATAWAVLGLALSLLVLKKRIRFTSLLTIVATATALYLPWFFYQKLYDPPGNRLLKMHLAGVMDVDPRSFWQALTTAYQHLSFQQIVSYKLANVVTTTDHQMEYWRGIAVLLSSLWRHNPASIAWVPQLAGWLRGLIFFYFVPALGFLVIGLPVLLVGISKRFRSPEWRAAVVMWVFVALTLVVFCIAEFGPATTVIHSGTYANVLLASAACVLALWALSPALACLIAAVQIALNFLLYVVLMNQPASKTLVPEKQLRDAQVAVAVLALILLFFLFRALATGRALHGQASPMPQPRSTHSPSDLPKAEPATRIPDAP